MDARIIKTRDEVELLKISATMVDSAMAKLSGLLNPGSGKTILWQLPTVLYTLGSDLVECVYSVSGTRAQPHPHTFSDRIIRPGDMVF